jgi:hypothetical protein
MHEIAAIQLERCRVCNCEFFGIRHRYVACSLEQATSIRLASATSCACGTHRSEHETGVSLSFALS